MMRWESCGEVIDRKVEDVLQTWVGTPYMPGQMAKGVQGGVDCVRFVAAVLDELYGFARAGSVPRLPPDTAMHTREGAILTMRAIRRRYMPNLLVRDGSLMPGDIVVVNWPNGGPGHAMIVGGRKNVLWHSTGKFVQQAGIGFIGADYHGWSFCGAYRPTDKERWVA